MEIRGGNHSAVYRADLPGLSAWVSCRPLQPAMRGGDLYYLSVCSQGSISRVTIADVAGHGETVSAVAGHLWNALREHADDWDQSTLIRRLNDGFLKGGVEGSYATAFLMSHYAASGELLFTNAGHLPPLWRRAALRRWTFLQDATPYAKEIADLPLGMIPGTAYRQTGVQLEPGDIVLLYTDGVSEAYNSQGSNSASIVCWRSRTACQAIPPPPRAKRFWRPLRGFAASAAQRRRHRGRPAVPFTLNSVPSRVMTAPQPIPADVPMCVTFVMSSHPRYLPVVRAAVGQLAAMVGWNESDSRAITLAVDEALANVIRHAYHGRADGRMELQCHVDGDELEFRLRDTGDAPDLTRICARDLGCDKIGGLGTHIIRDVMDSVSYRASPDGNWFVASKRLKRQS